jgi:hypothetical protein
METSKTKILILVFLAIATVGMGQVGKVWAWDLGSLLGSDDGYYQGQQDAIWDHNQGYQYNPTPACCHSEDFDQQFHRGYDSQWNSYQVQNSEQRTNVNVINSPGAYVNTEQSSNQGQYQSQGQGP